MRSNGIRHIKLAPYHPATNAMTFKQALRAALAEKKSISWKLANFLLAYRSTPHALTGKTPAVLLTGRNIRTRLDILKPNLRKRVEDKQQDQELRSIHSPARKLELGQAVVARNYRAGNKWVPGIITAHSGPLSYEVKVAPNTVWRRHVDQLRESAVTPNFNKEQYTPRLNPAVLAATPQSASSVENEELQAPTMSGMKEPWTKDTHVDNTPDNPLSSQSETMVSSPATPPCRRYPLQLRMPPERLNL